MAIVLKGLITFKLLIMINKLSAQLRLSASQWYASSCLGIQGFCGEHGDAVMFHSFDSSREPAEPRPLDQWAMATAKILLLFVFI